MAATDESALNVLVARRGAVDGVLDVLTDLSAVGLVRSFLWVVEDEVTRTTVHAMSVDRGRRRRTTLQSTLAARNFEHVRLVVLVPIIGQAQAPAIGTHLELSELLNSSAGRARVTRVRMLIVRPDGPQVRSATVEGWHNLLIAPEDARGPGSGHELLQPTTDPVLIGCHAAPAIASAVGLWAGIDHAPLDDSVPPPGQTIRVVRSFYRSIDTTSAESELRRQVFEAGTTLPLPRQHGESVFYIDDAAAAARSMAQAWWNKNRHLLRGQRATPPRVPVQTIGALEAIKMFFSFILAALKNSPGEWYAGFVRRVSTGVAGAVQSTVYGAQSEYSVVVNGVTAQGVPAQLDDIAAASDRLGTLLGDDHSHDVRADLSDVWIDFANGALTLADGGERSAEMPPIQIGANRGVMRSVSDCVVSEAERFVVPGPVAAALGIQSVSPSDVHAINGLAAALHAAERDPVVGFDAKNTGMALREWATANGRSYGSQIGRVLIDTLGATVREVRELMKRMKDRAEAPDVTNEARARQRILSMWMKLFGGALFVVLVALGLLFGFKLLSLLWTLVYAFVAIIAWAVASLSTFMKERRELFQEMARRQADSAQAEADRLNLRTALRDVNRLSTAYSQYLAWSRALGAVLRAPFGPEVARTPDRPQIGSGLPSSTKIGVARPSEDAVTNAAMQVRRELFRVNWLTPVWTKVVAEAGNGLGALGQDVRDNPRLLFASEGVGSGSPLDVWSARLAQGDITATGSDALWHQVLTSLSSPDSAAGVALRDHVETASEGGPRVVGLTEFLAGLDDGAAQLGVQYFDDELFTDTAASAGDPRITLNWPPPQQDRTTDPRARLRVGLGAAAVLTQFSDAIPEYQFKFVENGSTTPSLTVVPDWAAAPEWNTTPRGRTGSISNEAPDANTAPDFTTRPEWTTASRRTSTTSAHRAADDDVTSTDESQVADAAPRPQFDVPGSGDYVF